MDAPHGPVQMQAAVPVPPRPGRQALPRVRRVLRARRRHGMPLGPCRQRLAPRCQPALAVMDFLAAAEQALRELVAQADVITPNIAELAVLCESNPALTLEEAHNQAAQLAGSTGTIVI